MKPGPHLEPPQLITLALRAIKQELDPAAPRWQCIDQAGLTWCSPLR
jgi:hypothetical protein